MALVMVLLVLILTLSFFYLKCTTMQSLVMLWSSVVSTMIAFSFYEQLADMLIARGYGLQWAQVGAYAVVFAAAFALFRSAGEYVIGVKIDLGNTVKISSAVICGLFTGIILSGNLLVILGLLPLQGKVFYSRFDPAGPVTLSSPKAPALGTDGFVSGLYGLVSAGSMRSDKSFRVLHADYLNQLHLNKLKTRDKVPAVCSKDAIKVPSRKGLQPVRLWTSPDNEAFVVVRMGIAAKKVADGGAANADGLLAFCPAQIRLVAKKNTSDPAAKPLAGSARAFYPAGFIRDGMLVKTELNETISPDSKALQSRMLWQDVAFKMDPAYNPVLLEFKLNAVADLRSYTPVKSTPDIEDALNNEAADTVNKEG